jgi:hypothetical protein
MFVRRFSSTQGILERGPHLPLLNELAGGYLDGFGNSPFESGSTDCFSAELEDPL